MWRLGAVGALAVVAGRWIYRRLVAGDLVIDLSIGRTIRPLGPLDARIAAPRDLVFEVIAAPYLASPPSSVAEKIHVLEHSEEMVLAAHRTAVGSGMVATTVETVRFERPAAVHFRLVRGPVPHVVERFELTEDGEDTRSSTTRASSEPTSGPWASGGETWWLGDGTKRCGRRWPRSRGSPRCGRRVAGPDGRASRVTGRSAGRSRPRRTAIAGGSSGRSGSSPTNRCSSMPSRASFASDPSTRPTGASRSNGPGSPDDADPSGGRDRQELWPGEEHVGLPVLVPGGEEGRLLSFEHEDDPDRWTYSLEFRGMRE